MNSCNYKLIVVVGQTVYPIRVGKLNIITKIKQWVEKGHFKTQSIEH